MALEASLEQTGTRFGPSDRPPDPNWAVVPSNVCKCLHLCLVKIATDPRCISKKCLREYPKTTSRLVSPSKKV